MKKTNTLIDYLKNKEVEYINLDEYVRRGANDVYYVRIVGDKLADLGVFDGDLLVVDRQKLPKAGNFVVAQCGDTVILYVHEEKKVDIRLATVNGKRVIRSNHEPLCVDFRQDYLHFATVTFIVRNVGGESDEK